jgi:ABC-type multidrug transport system fused ATPase/permease subunit
MIDEMALLTGAPMGHWAIFLAVAAIPLAATFRRIERVQAEKLGQSYVEAIRKQFIRRTLQTPAVVLAGCAHGTMMLRFTGDIGAMRNWAARGLARLIVGATTLTAGAATLFWLDPIVGLTFAIISLLTIGLAARLTTNLSEKAKRPAKTGQTSRGALVRSSRRSVLIKHSAPIAMLFCSSPGALPVFGNPPLARPEPPAEFKRQQRRRQRQCRRAACWRRPSLALNLPPRLPASQSQAF